LGRRGHLEQKNGGKQASPLEAGPHRKSAKNGEKGKRKKVSENHRTPKQSGEKLLTRAHRTKRRNVKKKKGQKQGEKPKKKVSRACKKKKKAHQRSRPKKNLKSLKEINQNPLEALGSQKPFLKKGLLQRKRGHNRQTP